MGAQGSQTVLPPTVALGHGRAVPFQSEADDELCSTEIGPPLSCLIERGCKIIGLGDEVARTSCRHPTSVSLLR